MSAKPDTGQAGDRAVSTERERLLERVNDPTALNGGSAWHWYAPHRPERMPASRQRHKLVVAVLLWATLACGAVLLAASL